MKQRQIMIVGTFLAVLLAGCVSEHAVMDVPEDGRIVISAVAETPQTKTETTIGYECRFVPGDAIGVFAVMRGDDGLSVVPSSSGNFIHNAKFVYQEDGSWKEEGSTSYYAEDGKILDFFAYYPYVEDADPTALHYDASEKMCDFMVARKEWIDARGETVNFVFKHVLAMAEAYIVGADKLYDYSVTMDNVITEAVFTLASSEGSELVSIGDERHSVEMSGTFNVFRAWLPPQTVAKETELFTASGSDVETFVHTVPQEGLLSRGNVKKWLLCPSFTRPELLPNAYVVEPGQTIYLPVAKPFAVWEAEPLLDEGDMIGSLSASVEWEDERYILNNDQIQILGSGRDAVVQVRTVAGVEGNAVVSLSVGGTVRWSWHLWITGYNPNLSDNQKTNNGYTFMDRNLGAMTSEAGNTDAMGLQYQWGRSNPFPCAADFASTQIREVWDGFGQKRTFTSKAVSSEEAANMKVAVTDPMTMIAGMQESYDWLSEEPDYNRYRWQDENGDKTAYDPCPYGWRVVPDTDAFSGLSSASGGWNYGGNWTGAGYWPACGINEIKYISWNGSCGYYWTSLACDEPKGMDEVIRTTYSFFVDASNTMVTSHYKFYPLNVRCVKE